MNRKVEENIFSNLFGQVDHFRTFKWHLGGKIRHNDLLNKAFEAGNALQFKRSGDISVNPEPAVGDPHVECPFYRSQMADFWVFQLEDVTGILPFKVGPFMWDLFEMDFHKFGNSSLFRLLAWNVYLISLPPRSFS